MEPTRTTPENIRLTPAALDALRAEKNRTRVSFAQLLKDAPDIPRGLDAAVIGRWLKGECRSARAAHLTWVMERYRQLPDSADATKLLPPRSHRREPVDEGLRNRARRLYDAMDEERLSAAMPGLGRSGLYAIAAGAAAKASAPLNAAAAARPVKFSRSAASVPMPYCPFHAVVLIWIYPNKTTVFPKAPVSGQAAAEAALKSL